MTPPQPIRPSTPPFPAPPGSIHRQVQLDGGLKRIRAITTTIEILIGAQPNSIMQAVMNTPGAGFALEFGPWPEEAVETFCVAMRLMNAIQKHGRRDLADVLDRLPRELRSGVEQAARPGGITGWSSPEGEL